MFIPRSKQSLFEPQDEIRSRLNYTMQRLFSFWMYHELG